MVLLRNDGCIETDCTCGTRDLCVHVVAATLLALTAHDEQARPNWQRELDDALGFDSTLPDEEERCLFLGIRQPKPYSYSEPDVPHIAVRAGARGSRGGWVKSRSSWNRIDEERRHSRASAALMRLVHAYQIAAGTSGGYYYSTPEWLPLRDLPGEEVWFILRRIQDAGVALIFDDKAQHPVELRDEPVSARIEVSGHGSGAELRAVLQVADEEHRIEDGWWIGDPTTILADVTGTPDAQRAILYRSDAPMPRVAQQLLARGSAMRIPSASRDSFLRDYLPRLQADLEVISPDSSIDIPPPPAPTLALQITYVARQVHLAWSWDRPAGIRDGAREQQIADAVIQAFAEHPGLLERGPSGPPADRTFGQASAVAFVSEVQPLLRAVPGLRIEENEQTPEYRAAGGLPLVGVRSADDGDWLDLHVTVSVDGEDVDFAELFTALTLDEPIFVLPSGTYFPLDGPEFASLRAIIEEARALTDKPGSDLRVSRYQVDLWEELTELGIITAQESAWWLAVQSLRSDAAVERVDPPAGLHAELRDYQAAGLSWLHFLRTNGLGGLLADDMGLGKTLQTIAMMELAREEQPDRPPFLVVAPTSVVGNWASEVARFAPQLRVATITAMESRRGEALADAVRGAHVVVTSYALFRLEDEAYRDLEWSGLVLDEAQQIKNPASAGYKAARTLGAPFTLVITGTPMENNLDELWALASLAAPGLLGSRKQFGETYRKPIEKERDAERLARLQRRLRPFLLRRTKELVAAELPPKQEQVLEVTLHPKHRKLYDVRFQRERQKLLGLVDDVNANRIQIFRSLTLLRQLALDPELVDAGAAPSAKLDALIELLTEAAEEGHRVLVLSQFTRFLGAARDRAAAAGLSYAYLDGSTTNRPAVIDGFRGGDTSVFFVSLKAGGVGLNLVEADYVVLLDPWWNPAVEEQAIDRAHRIGQTRPVIVYRLVSADTIEQKVIALREAKAELFARVFDGEGVIGAGSLTADDINALLE
ncbi:ATP-dependent helicase [Microbacterium bovistercoris]|uniref:ATP-dependent helicase n=2 Tax=Microbacterium bovistercoris TaxID=2293570 RepID=A0A371NSL0_9MICO|nr:ATP-dependent helicase [Microbacterium bovistercoris]